MEYMGQMLDCRGAREETEEKRELEKRAIKQLYDGEKE